MKSLKLTTFEQLKQKLNYMSEEEIKEIKKSYDYALIKYQDMKYINGEDYINYHLNVASILSEIHADKYTISASILSDITTDIEFDPEITKLVNSLTKINNLNFNSENEAMIANERKILVGLTEDVRVIIIKLADRLQTMRDLMFYNPTIQKEKAKETLDIYTPIAHRLGINKIKSELEDLSLRYLKPDVYYQIVERLNKTKQERDNYVHQMILNVSDILNKNHIKHEIKGRSKSIYSIYKKLDKGKTFNEIYDLLALRVFVSKESECYQALGLIHAKYKPVPKRFKDYIAMPKTNMYQSLHTTVFGIDGMVFEIQIRTYEMDKVAEKGIASHWSYKEGKNDMQNEMEQKLQFFRVIMELNQEETNDTEFVEKVKEEIFKDTIYVFTPMGDVIELPNGATPIDFAYRVHSKVGDTMIGAIVNDNIVPLDYKLKDNDIVKINTNKNSNPNKEWINIAYTNQAKNKIKSYFNKTIKEDYVKKGEESLTKELRKRKISNNDFNSNIDKILSEFKCTDLNELYIEIGNGKYSAIQILNSLNENTDKTNPILKRAIDKEVTLPNPKNDIVVANIDDIKINIASCCKPIKGDEIIGYITKGNGITVHNIKCPNISDLQERIIEVSWNNIDKKYPTTLLVRTLDNKNVLMDIIAKTSNNDIIIDSIKNINNDLYEITVLVANKEKLNKYINDLNMVPDILSIERKMI